MQVSDLEIIRHLLYEFGGDAEKAMQYANRISAVKGPLATQYDRVARRLATVDPLAN